MFGMFLIVILPFRYYKLFSHTQNIIINGPKPIFHDFLTFNIIMVHDDEL